MLEEPEVIHIGGPDPVPIADCGEEIGFLSHDIKVRKVRREGDLERVEAMGLVGSATVHYLRSFYLAVLKASESGDYRMGRNTALFAREILPKLAVLDFKERIDQRQRDDGTGRVDFIRRSTGEVLIELAPTEIAGSVAAYMQVYRDISREAREGHPARYPEIAANVEDLLPRLYKLSASEIIDDARDEDGRLLLKVRSTGEVLGYVPKVELRSDEPAGE